MNVRKLVYLMAFAILLVYVFQNTGKQSVPSPDLISKQSIVKDFEDLEGNDVPDGELGGTYYATDIYFTADFTGGAGDVFYVAMEDGHVLMTRYYIISETTDPSSKAITLQYNVKDTFENYRIPEGKYETYSYTNGKWTKP